MTLQTDGTFQEGSSRDLQRRIGFLGAGCLNQLVIVVTVNGHSYGYGYSYGHSYGHGYGYN